ncbi:hypothetical protein JCM3766R1_000915 [Sporobolomyces carnicolor]
MLLPRQQESPALYGSTASASSRTTGPTSLSASSSSSSDNSNEARNALWKYAIVVILAILALSTVFRLLFIRRARRLQRENNLGLRHHSHFRGGGGRSGAHGEDRRRFSTDSLDVQERALEPPPPAYEESGAPAANSTTNDPFPPPAQPLPVAPVEARPSFISRLFSRFKRAPSTTSTPPATAASPPANEDFFALSMQQATSPRQAATARILAEENQSNQRRGHVAIRRALSDAGLLTGVFTANGRNRASSRSDGGAPTSHRGVTIEAAEQAQREREERRRARRERRRERRRRERERDEGLGLPVYSKKKAEGEEVLQVADGIKEDETDSDEGEEEEDDEAEGEQRESGIDANLPSSSNRGSLAQGPSHGQHTSVAQTDSNAPHSHEPVEPQNDAARTHPLA